MATPGNRRKEEKQTSGVLLLQDNALAHMSQDALTAAMNVDLKFFLVPHILLKWFLFSVPKTEIPSS